MQNLLQETDSKLKQIGKTPEDITFIGSFDSGHACTWEEFQKLADFEYDDGYGGRQVAGDLKILFKDGTFLERGEYDGAEWWEYKPKYKIPRKIKPIERLARDEDHFWSTSLERLHEEE